MHRVKVRVVEDALDANNTIASANRADFDREGVTVLNLMSAPGAGKTTLLEAVFRAGLSPTPRSSTSVGSQATITTLPLQPPTALTNRRTVCGSMPCGLTTSPSSIEGAISSRSGSRTYSVPGSPPWRETSIKTSAW